MNSSHFYLHSYDIKSIRKITAFSHEFEKSVTIKFIESSCREISYKKHLRFTIIIIEDISSLKRKSQACYFPAANTRWGPEELHRISANTQFDEQCGEPEWIVHPSTHRRKNTTLINHCIEIHARRFKAMKYRKKKSEQLKIGT